MPGRRQRWQAGTDDTGHQDTTLDQKEDLVGAEAFTRLVRELHAHYGEGGDALVVQAPGRVNLIGEHTDYNEGFVFPMAIGRYIRLAARPRRDGRVHVTALDVGAESSFEAVSTVARDEEQPWSNYVRGVVKLLVEAGVPVAGADIVFTGDIPIGGGLSSSAALEVATANLFLELAGVTMDGPEVAKLGQRAENEFVGMSCGIMDQFISQMGRAGHALMLDCRSLEHRHVPLRLGEHVFAIVQSGVKHSLVDSAYNERRAECEQGVRTLSMYEDGINALRDVTPEVLSKHVRKLQPSVERRVRHVVVENARVQASVAALEQGDLVRFGQLMGESHDSLRDLYAVSCEEIDLLVNLARGVSGVLGARLTGGGFGGCTVNLLRKDALDRFAEGIVEPYRERTGITPEIIVTDAVDGAAVVTA